MKKSLSFYPPFVTEVTADRINHGKPNPECYNLALKELGVAPEHVIVFEDSVSGVRSAAGSNATVIGVNELHLQAALLENGAVNVIQNFKSATVDSNQQSLHFTSR
jgi:beta-phosphoglucomutase-like phosphatase (HAD superfamily)